MILMQAFYWDCPQNENKAGQWWNYIRSKIPNLSSNGITTLWLPPSAKGGHTNCMGYAPYDYYDQGEFDQRGGIKTWFGSKDELKELIRTAHDHNMTVLADMVLNHCDIGDEAEFNPISNKLLYTRYYPKSGKFKRDWTYFHPCEYDEGDHGAFYGDLEGYWLPDLCHDNPYTYLEIMEYIRWLRDDKNGIGYDGFRYDAVKYYDSWIVESIQDWQKCFGVVEFWDGDKNHIKDYLNYIGWSASAFDYPLFYTLNCMCSNDDFDMRNIWGNGLIFDLPMRSVTFCENHDTERIVPIIRDKLLAYAYILTHEGVPCIFWRDYYNYELGMEETPHGLEQLSRINRDYAGGTTSLLYCDKNLYIAQRNGSEGKPGLVIALNNSYEWRGSPVKTQWSSTRMKCESWWGRDLNKPEDKLANDEGFVDFYAPPRGFAVYIPEV
ncbi:MAG: DUF1939 domain-containing protein [Clostridia bacterium]|nr:DUF1939 domain-containing protein [Clostridia bacterium]